MKKSQIAAVVVAALLVGCIGFAGCGSGDSSSDGSGKTGASESSDSSSPYKVKIGKMKVTKNYEGKKCAVVEYKWTNGEEKATSFAVAVSDKAFQDGVELESTVTSSDSKYDTEKSWKEIKPGKTQTVYKAYLIKGKKDIEVEVKEFISLNDDILASKTFKLK